MTHPRTLRARADVCYQLARSAQALSPERGWWLRRAYALDLAAGLAEIRNGRRAAHSHPRPNGPAEPVATGEQPSPLHVLQQP